MLDGSVLLPITRRYSRLGMHLASQWERNRATFPQTSIRAHFLVMLDATPRRKAWCHRASWGRECAVFFLLFPAWWKRVLLPCLHCLLARILRVRSFCIMHPFYQLICSATLFPPSLCCHALLLLSCCLLSEFTFYFVWELKYYALRLSGPMVWPPLPW